MVKSVGKYDLYKTLGQGSFGKVKYAVNRETNEAVAIKILDKDKIQKKNMGAQIKKEISIMKMISHKFVVSVKDVFATATKIFIVLELIEGGELFDKIANDGKLPEDQARFYFKQLLDGLTYCHEHGVCHRDLKPENLLLDSDGNIKISDFGLATLYIGDATAEGSSNRTELLHTTCGTPNYVAPEVLSNQGYDGRCADVWSIGVILYVLLAGFLPFEEKTIAALFSKIKAADYSYPSWFSPDARSLLDGILVANPAKRFTLEQVKSHPWCQGPVNNPKAGTIGKTSSEYRREQTGEPAPIKFADMNIPEVPESNDASSSSQKPEQTLVPPPAPVQKSGSFAQRGSFFSGGLAAEDTARSATMTQNGSQASSTGATTSGTARVNKTQRAPPPRSVFSCFCAPFGGLADVDYSDEVTSPQGSPRPLPVA